MFRDSYIKFLLILIIVIYGVLAVMPQQVVHIENQYLTRDLVFGGYNFSLFNNKINIDLRNFTSSVNIVGGEEVILEPAKENPSQEELEKSRESLINRIESLKALPTGSFIVEIIDNKISVKHPRIEDKTQLNNAISGNGNVQFKQLKQDVEWNQEEALNFYLNPDLWENTSLNEEDLRLIVPVGEDNEGGQSFQVVFTQEGLQEFSETAQNNVGKPLALYLNNSQQPFAMPVIPEEFSGGVTSNPTIRGNINEDQITRLNTQLGFEEIPLDLSISETREIEPIITPEILNTVLMVSTTVLLALWIILTALYRKYGFLSGLSIIIFALVYLGVVKGSSLVVSLQSVAGAGFVFVLYIVLSFILARLLRKEYLMDRPGLAVVNLGFKNFWRFTKYIILGLLFVTTPLYFALEAVWKILPLTVMVGLFVMVFNLVVVTRSLFDLYGRGKK